MNCIHIEFTLKIALFKLVCGKFNSDELVQQVTCIHNKVLKLVVVMNTKLQFLLLRLVCWLYVMIIVLLSLSLPEAINIDFTTTQIISLVPVWADQWQLKEIDNY